MNEDSIKLFRKNAVLIRGVFDTSAEAFAREYGLRFLHTDVELARDSDYFTSAGIDVITLRFCDDGSAYINQENYCQGSSAGSSGGGEINVGLPGDFYMTKTPKNVADMCWGNCREEILKRGKLAEAMKKAKEKKGFLLRFKA